MKVLTLHQPWASLVALGVKRIETRSWSTQYRGPLAIHAGRKVVYGAVGDYRAETWFSDVQHIADRCYCDEGEVDLPCTRGATRTPCLTRTGAEPIMLPLGAIVATCMLVDVVPIIAEEHCEWHIEHARSVGACAHSAIDGQVITHTPVGRYHTAVLVEAPYGDFAADRYAWLLADVVPVDPHVPFKGGQGLTRTWEPVVAS